MTNRKVHIIQAFLIFSLNYDAVLIHFSIYRWFNPNYAHNNIAAFVGKGDDSPDEDSKHASRHYRYKHTTHRPKSTGSQKSKSPKRVSHGATEHDALHVASSDDTCTRLAIDPAHVDNFKITFKVYILSHLYNQSSDSLHYTAPCPP